MGKIQVVMTANEFVEKAKKVAELKTLYVYGGLGQNGTTALKKRAIASNSYNASKSAKINATDEDTWFFDCVGLIKALLSGFTATKINPSTGKAYTYGGALYWDNGVVDCGAKVMMNTYCTDHSTDFNNILIGECVWLAESSAGADSHIGIYIGNGKVVECTPKWNDGVQISQFTDSKGAKYRKWTKHGKLPWIDYSSIKEEKTTETTTKIDTSKVASAKKYNAKLAGEYTTTTSINLRCDATPKSTLVTVMPSGTKVKCYGYYSLNGLTKWYLIQTVIKGVLYTGYAHSSYLKKC